MLYDLCIEYIIEIHQSNLQPPLSTQQQTITESLPNLHLYSTFLPFYPFHFFVLC